MSSSSQDSGVSDIALDHFAIEVSDLDPALAFYTAIGFEETHRLDTADRLHVFAQLPGRRGGLQLTWSRAADQLTHGEPRWSGHAALAVGSLDATLRRLAAHGIEPDRGPLEFPQVNARVAFVRDPDGYEIELVERVR